MVQESNMKRRRYTNIATTAFVILLLGGLVVLNSPALFRAPSSVLAVTATDGYQARSAQGQAALTPDNIATIKQGEASTLILTKDGQLYTSGENRFGQLASGSFGGDQADLRRVDMPAGERFTQVDMTHRHALALSENGDVWAWGFNLSGQIGNNSRKDVSSPVKVFSGATSIAAGYRFSAAINRQGQLWAWGMYCDPSTPGLEKLAAQFAHDISVGGSYYDGRAQSDAIYCLEEENLPIASILPRQIEPLNTSRFTSVSAGYGSLPMLDDRQQAWGFGCNAWGQLGRGHARNDGGTRRITKVAFPEGERIVQLQAGFRHGVALTSDGKLWSWGRDMQGDPLTYKSNRTDRPEIMASAPADIKTIAAGHDVSGLVAGSGFYASGDNQQSQISRELGDKRQYVVQPFVRVGTASQVSLGYVRHIYW